MAAYWGWVSAYFGSRRWAINCNVSATSRGDLAGGKGIAYSLGDRFGVAVIGWGRASRLAVDSLDCTPGGVVSSRSRLLWFWYDGFFAQCTFWTSPHGCKRRKG